jgi:hypothetical protein
MINRIFIVDRILNLMLSLHSRKKIEALVVRIAAKKPEAALLFSRTMCIRPNCNPVSADSKNKEISEPARSTLLLFLLFWFSLVLLVL